MRDLLSETTRNSTHHRVFIRFLHRAFGMDAKVMVAHHFVVIPNGKPPIEIPSADSLWFDTELMEQVFGNDDAAIIMATLASRKPDDRETFVSGMLDALDVRDPSRKTEFVTA
jgi:hypothetical protein